jgi:hypothetical protein
MADESLQQYGALSAPRCRPLRDIELGPRQVGTVGKVLNREGCPRIYVSERDAQEHYYEVGDGWALSDELFGRLQTMNARRVLIVDSGSDDAYEYALRQFMRGEGINQDNPKGHQNYSADPQHVVPAAEAEDVWTDHADGVWMKNALFRD